MASKKVHTVFYRRKRQGKTNYKKRITLLKSKKPRLVVRRTNKNVIVQIAEFNTKGDKIVLSMDTRVLGKYGWIAGRKNLSAAYLLGLLVAKKSPIKEAILDIGLRTPTNGSVVFAVLKGVVDGGLAIPHSDKMLPSEDRISGKHISKYLETADSSSTFQNYKKEKIDAKKFENMFNSVKEKILNEK